MIIFHSFVKYSITSIVVTNLPITSMGKHGLVLKLNKDRRRKRTYTADALV